MGAIDMRFKITEVGKFCYGDKIFIEPIYSSESLRKEAVEIFWVLRIRDKEGVFRHVGDYSTQGEAIRALQVAMDTLPIHEAGM